MSTAISSIEHYIPSLNILPPEIRDQIWLLCLTPRTLQLHIHHHEKFARKKLSVAKRFTNPPAKLDHKDHLFGSFRSPRRRATRTAGISFTATLVEEGKSPQFYLNEEEFKKAHRSSEACPVAPALLQVCRESRAIALQRYELIFSGKSSLYQPNKPTPARLASEKAWVKRHLGPGRIWFDFTRDTLMLHSPSEIGVSSSGRLAPLSNLVYHAKDELHRIENLVVGLTNARARYSNQPGYYGNADFERNIMKFTSLRDLIIYDLSPGIFGPLFTSIATLQQILTPVTIEEMTTYLVSNLKILKEREIYWREEKIEHFNPRLQVTSDVVRTQQMADLNANWPELPPLPHLTVLRIPKL